MAIIKVHNKARNITYVYESISYWDKELKQPRSHRKLIGRIDPITGDIVPTGKQGKSELSVSDHSDTDYKSLYEEALATIEQKDALIRELRGRLAAAESANKSCHRSIKKACDILMDAASGKERING